MSGKNIAITDIPPGMSSDGTVYSTGKRWRTGSLVRWLSGLLIPIGGWVTFRNSSHVKSIRDAFSWRDYLKVPWVALGSENKLTALNPNGNPVTEYDITPAGLNSTGTPKSGFGSGAFGAGPFGGSTPYVQDATGMWSMDNYGRTLIAVHTQDGRLFQWDPLTPTVKAAPIAEAPISSTFCVVTQEDFVMLFGGRTNSRQIKWSSQRDIHDWTPTEINSAGGFELKSNGSIKAVKRVQGGILVITDADVHIIEYIGPPNYYSRRRISESGGVLGKNAVAAIPGGAVWMSASNFWIFDGNITKMECPVHSEVFPSSNLVDTSRIHMGVNEYFQEIWTFFPDVGSSEPDRYVLFSYTKDIFWATGYLARTAQMAPVWGTKPYMMNGAKVYQHEVGWTDDGADRNVYASTGGIELDLGDANMYVDRVWSDATSVEAAHLPANPSAYSVSFGLRQAPDAAERIVGPISFNSANGYRSVRFRAREVTLKVQQTISTFWVLGKLRLRVKQGTPGGR